MIDVSKIKYRLTIMTENKKQYNIKDFVENLGWEENDGELAVRISFTAKNEKQVPASYHLWQNRDVWSVFSLNTALPMRKLQEDISLNGNQQYPEARISSMLCAMTNCIICRKAKTTFTILPESERSQRLPRYLMTGKFLWRSTRGQM